MGTTLAQLSSGQAQKEVTVNEDFAAVSPAGAFAKRPAGTSGLTWAFYGGEIVIDGAPTTIANNTVALTASQTNYIEITRAGTVAAVLTSFTPGRIPLYVVTTDATAITGETDRRSFAVRFAGRASFAVTTADVTLSNAQARCELLEATGTLTGNRSVILPTQAGVWLVHNNTAGAFSLTFKTLSGSGVVVGQKRRAILACDGTNVTRVDSDPQGQDIAYAAAITPDAAAGAVVRVGQLTGALTVNAPSNPALYAALEFLFEQDATGGRVITWDAAFKKGTDGAGTASQKGSTRFRYDGAYWVQQGGALAWF